MPVKTGSMPLTTHGESVGSMCMAWQLRIESAGAVSPPPAPDCGESNAMSQGDLREAGSRDK